MFGIFKREHGGGSHSQEKFVRHSRGWGEIRKHLQESDTLRVLDFGATSPTNINFLTALGHSVYMANIVHDAASPDWRKAPEAGSKPGNEGPFDTEGFLEANLDFAGRDFDLILLWDTVDYLPPEMVSALFARLQQVLRPGGKILGFFHGKVAGPETVFVRYQLSETDDLVAVQAGNFPVRQVIQNRQVEKYLDQCKNFRFFLGKDNVREVIATR
jgi:SAM-dependent methyltransferase